MGNDQLSLSPAVGETFHGHRGAPRRSRPTIIVQGDPFAPLAIDVGIGEPGLERIALTVQQPGRFSLDENIDAGTLLSVRARVRSRIEMIVTITWDDPR